MRKRTFWGLGVRVKHNSRYSTRGMKEIKPIKSQKEADNVFNYLVAVTIIEVKIDRLQAEKRVRRLLDSNELNGLTPDNELFQMIVNRYIKTPI